MSDMNYMFLVFGAIMGLSVSILISPAMYTMLTKLYDKLYK